MVRAVCAVCAVSVTQGDQYISISVCPSLCNKLWDACHDQQDKFGIHPKALTARQLCSALLIEEEDKEGPQGGVNVVIAPGASHVHATHHTHTHTHTHTTRVQVVSLALTWFSNAYSILDDVLQRRFALSCREQVRAVWWCVCAVC
jgi:hypothetical protein